MTNFRPIDLKTPIPALYGVRGVAILAILTHHLAAVDSPSPAAGLWNGFVSGCWIGVDLFFVLSSFLITCQLINARSAPHFFRNFYRRRVLRIFPLYYAFLIFYYLLVFKLRWVAFIYEPLEQAEYDFQSLWLFLSNIQIAYDSAFLTSSINHFWTLAVEEQFYLVWPFLCFMFAPKQLFRMCGVLVLLAISLRIYLISRGDYSYAIYVLTPTRIDSFAIGGMIAILVNQNWSREFLLRAGRALFVPSSVAVLILWLSRGTLNPGDSYVQSVGYTILAVAFGSGILLAALGHAQNMFIRILSYPPLQQLGKMSFAIYVIHYPLHIYLQERFHPGNLAAYFGSAWLAALVYFAAVSVLSWTSARCFSLVGLF